MGDRKQPNPPPGEPGYTGPANQVRPAPPPPPPAKRADTTPCVNCGNAKSAHIAIADGRALLCSATGALSRSGFAAESDPVFSEAPIRHTAGPWKVESRGTGEYDIIAPVNRRVAGYISLPDARLMAQAPYMFRVLRAVLHQMEHGEASDILSGEVTNRDSVRDLCWCRNEIKQVLKALS